MLCRETVCVEQARGYRAVVRHARDIDVLKKLNGLSCLRASRADRKTTAAS